MTPVVSFVLKKETSRGCPQKEGSQRGTNKRKTNTCPGADVTLGHGAPAASGHGETWVSVEKGPSLGLILQGDSGCFHSRLSAVEASMGRVQLVREVMPAPWGNSPIPPTMPPT